MPNRHRTATPPDAGTPSSLLAPSCSHRLTTATSVPPSPVSEVRAVSRAGPGDPSGAGMGASTPAKQSTPPGGRAARLAGAIRNCVHARMKVRQGVADARGRGLYRKHRDEWRHWSEGGRRKTTGGRCGPSHGGDDAAKCRRVDKTGDGHAAPPAYRAGCCSWYYRVAPTTRWTDSMGCTQRNSC